VGRIPTTVTLTSSSLTVSAGQAITLTATVAATGGSIATTTGTVTFFDNGNQVGSSALINGVATLRITPLNGSHTFTAAFTGDNTFAPAASGPVAVSGFNPNITITASGTPNPSEFGQVVTMIAQVSAGATGTVTFKEGTTLNEVANLNSGVATVTVSNLSVGTHTITATYGGDPNFNSASTSFSLTVNKASTSTSLSGAPTSVPPGAQVTFSARVSSFTATGSITFREGSTTLGSKAVANGGASITASFQTTGNHVVTATYSGDDNYNGSTSNAVTIAVGLPASTTTLTASPATAEFGQSVALTAAVSPAGATGTVTITDGSNSQTVAPGVAATFPNLSIGTHTFTAHYSGDSAFAPSDSNSVTVTITKGTSRTTISATPNPGTVGQPVTVTATVQPGSGSTAPTGSVTFTVDGSAGQAVALSGGTASFTATGLTEGTHTFSASYGGDANFSGSSSQTLSVPVNPATQTLAISAPASMPNGTVGVAYPQQTLTATGGTQPFTWSLVSASTTAAGFSVANSGNNGVLTGTPAAAGNFQITVQVQDNSSPRQTASRTYNVTFAFAPLPQITISSTQLTLPGYPLALRGTLQLSFTPNASNLPANYTNPQLVFASNSQSSVQVDIPAGATAPITIPTFQQGSVAGTISVTLTGVTTTQGAAVTPFPSPAPVATITVARSAPVITANSLTFTASGSGLQVAFNATSNTRELTKADLTFTAASGTQLSGTTLSVDLASAASQYFSGTQGVQNGGAVSITIPLNFSGDQAARPTAVSVTVSNAVGTSAAAAANRQ